ncbi:hypothetical protein SALBM135S_10105 [Streptomyces alboniger]
MARKLRSSPMGAELDNLSDLISFGLAPAYFVLVYGMVADDAHQRVAAVGAIGCFWRWCCGLRGSRA